MQVFDNFSSKKAKSTPKTRARLTEPSRKRKARSDDEYEESSAEEDEDQKADMSDDEVKFKRGPGRTEEEDILVDDGNEASYQVCMYDI